MHIYGRLHLVSVKVLCQNVKPHYAYTDVAKVLMPHKYIQINHRKSFIVKTIVIDIILKCNRFFHYRTALISM